MQMRYELGRQTDNDKDNDIFIIRANCCEGELAVRTLSKHSQNVIDKNLNN